MTFAECLLCGRELQLSGRWRYLLTNEFTRTMCVRCEQKFELYEGAHDEVVSVYRYNEAMQNYVQRMKFGQDVLLAHVFRTQIAQALRHESALIVPIPMHPENKRRRTFAHVDEMLKAANIRYTHMLQKKTTEMLAQKNRAERLQMSQLFDVVADVNGKNICIVDDIYTTGTTIAHARQALLAAGANNVNAWTLIHG